MTVTEERDTLKEFFDEYAEMAEEFSIDRRNLVELVRYKKGNYIVFIDTAGDFDWVTSDTYDFHIEKIDNEISKIRNELISEVEFAQHKPIRGLLSKGLFKHLIYMLAETFTYILDENYGVAREHLGKINTFLIERNYEMSRKWHLLSSGLSTIIAFVFFGVIHYMFKNSEYQNETILNYLIYIPFGALGATISIFQGAKKKEYNCESGKFLNILEVNVRLVTGMVASFLAICLFNLEFVFTIFKDSAFSFEALSVICFIVGFSERFIPSIVNKFEANEFKGE